MSNNITWVLPNGEWGIDGVDLANLPPKVYGALAKLMRLEHPIRVTVGDHLRRFDNAKMARWLVHSIVVPAIEPAFEQLLGYLPDDLPDSGLDDLVIFLTRTLDLPVDASENVSKLDTFEPISPDR